MPHNSVAIKICVVGLLSFLGFFIFNPLLQLFRQSFYDDGFTFLNYVWLFEDSDLVRVGWNSFKISLLSACTATLLGFFAAYCVHWSNLPRSLCQFIRYSVLLPILLPTLTYGFAIIYTFGQQGLLFKLIGYRPFSEIYGFQSLWLGYTLYCLPVAFLLINNTFYYLDRKSTAVSILMGDNPPRKLYITVLFPLSTTLVSSLVQCFFLSFTDFGIPASVGGNYEVIAIKLYNQIMGAYPSFGRGSVVALVMLLPSLASLLILKFSLRYNTHVGSVQNISLQRNRLRDTLLGIFGLLLGLSVIACFAVIIIIPFVHNWPYDLSFSWQTILHSLQRKNLSQVYINSLYCAFLTAFFGTLLAFITALIVTRTTGWSRAKLFIEGTVLVTNTVPGMVLGITYLFTFNNTNLANTFAIIVLCNIVHYLTTPYLMSRNTLLKLPNNLEAVSHLMGDRWLQTVGRVLLPSTIPTLIEMFSFYFVTAMTTVSAIIFLTSSRTMIMTGKLKELQYLAEFDQIFVLSGLIFMTNICFLLLVQGIRVLYKNPAQPKP